MKKPAAAEASSSFEPSLVIYGKDDGGKPHASAFSAEDADLAVKAAGLMQMVALHVDNDECRVLAQGLPKGRIFASGRGFTPFCTMETYQALQAFGGDVPPAPDELTSNVPFLQLATSWDSIDVGQLVLAPETTPSAGWFEAVVVEVKPEDLIVLRWHAWPDEPPIARRRDDLALLRQAPDEKQSASE